MRAAARDGWWRHRHGGYGWVGPVFWPFAYYDFYDYAMWGYGYDDPFWDYGYGDIYAGIFSPYGYDDLAGYWPQGSSGGQVSARPGSGAKAATPDQLADLCGEDSRDIAGLPIDQIQKAIQPDDAQRAALDDLANASVKAAQDIRAACPTKIALTAPARLAAMQTRIEALISAVDTVQPPLQKFYGLLTDDQKARLNALGEDQRRADAAKKNGSLAGNCGATQPGVTGWPSAEIDAKLHPTDAQRASLTALQDATAKAADMLKASCQTQRSHHAARAARGRPQTARRHAAGGQGRAHGARRLLRQIERRAEGAVRGDRPGPLGGFPSIERGTGACSPPPLLRQHQRTHSSFHVDGAVVKRTFRRPRLPLCMAMLPAAPVSSRCGLCL